MQPTTSVYLFTALPEKLIRVENRRRWRWGSSVFSSSAAALLILNGVSAARPAVLVGGWRPIENVSDPHVQEIGKFAVTEHNKKATASLKFQSVVSGETQVVAGTNYRLVIAAADGGASNKYEAVVWEKSWMDFRSLTSFKRV